MIVSFSVENFRSFRSETTLSMVASNRLGGEHGDHAVAIPGSSAKVLRTAVIYGANGAGKSNLFKALRFLRWLAQSRIGNDGGGLGREAFRFVAGQATPTAFDLQFIARGTLYRYSIRIDDRQVLEECLSETIGNREEVIFQRGRSRDVFLGDQVKNYPRLAALGTVGAPPDQSFLCALSSSGLPPSDIGPELESVRQWFWTGLILLGPDESRWGKLNDDASLLEFVSDFLRSSATGVDRLELVKTPVSQEELPNLLGESRARELADAVAVGAKCFKFVTRAGCDGWVEGGGAEGCRLVRIQSAHRVGDGNPVGMDLGDESDGTRRLLDLLPAIHQLQKTGGVYFVDEIDRSMHPILVKRLFEFFLNSCAGSMSQLIVTTHESNLLDLDLLRRDEIWFAEKDHEQATRLYSLADFKVRKDLEIRKNYLQGRFGAIPFLGSLDSLMKGQNGTE